MDKLDKEKIVTTGEKLKKFLINNEDVKPLRKLYSVFIAVGFGLLIGMIPIAAEDGSVSIAYEQLFTSFTQNSILTNTMMNLFVTYGLLSLGTAVAFKAGVLNIGATGQFLAGGSLTLILGFNLNDSISQDGAIPLMLVVSALGGALVAVMAALLKVYFRINEVVSTLLLNWVIYFVFKIVFFDLPLYRGTNGNFTKNIGSNFSFALNGSTFMLPLIIFLLLVLSMFVILTFTTFGKKIKACGVGFDAARANGIPVNSTFIATFAISGALCGLAGAFFYSYQGSINLEGATLPAYAFNAIAIALLAYNQPLGVVFTSLFYAILESGKPATNLANIEPEAINLVLAIIIFLSALSIIFIKARPLKYLIEELVYRKNENYKKQVHELRELRQFRRGSEDYSRAKKNIKVLNERLQERQAIEMKLKTPRDKDSEGIEGAFFTKGFQERDKIIKKRKEFWKNYVDPIDNTYEEQKTSLKLLRRHVIDEWYKNRKTWQLFIMRVFA